MCYKIVESGEPISDGFYMSRESARKALETLESADPEGDYSFIPA